MYFYTAFLVDSNIFNVGHSKTDLKVFVIPKEGLVGCGPANPSLGMTLTTDLKHSIIKKKQGDISFV